MKLGLACRKWWKDERIPLSFSCETRREYGVFKPRRKFETKIVLGSNLTK
jgi:hypothetical protein